MRYIFEIIDDDGEVRAYIASSMRREADKLMVRNGEMEVGLEIFRICDWCAVSEDEDEDLRLQGASRSLC